MHKEIKNKISLDMILLFVLGINFILTVSNWHYIKFIPINFGLPRNFIFFYTFFILFIFYYIISKSKKINYNLRYYIKLCIIILLIFVFIIITGVYQILLRKKGADPIYVHDGILVSEQAIKYLDEGKNPYVENYKESFSYFIEKYGQRERDNPVWHHYVYLPYYFLFSWPFYKVSHYFFGFFDQRIVHIFIFIFSLILIYKIPKNKNKKLIALLLFAFNPLFFPWFFNGHNDIFIFFWLILSIYLLTKRKYIWSSLFLGLACVSKHQAWLFLPFYFIYLFYSQNLIKNYFRRALITFKKMWLTFLIFIIFLTPFLFWNYGTFIEDIIEYPAGKSAHVLPVVGYGISYFLYMIGIIKDQWDYYPFWIWQVIFCLPLFYYFVRKQKINNNLKQLVFNYGVFVFVFLFFSRYLNTNYISYLSMIFLSAYLIEDKYFFKKNSKLKKK